MCIFWEEGQEVCVCERTRTPGARILSKHVETKISQMWIFINLVTTVCNFPLFSYHKLESYILEILILRERYMLIGFLILYPGQTNQLNLIKYNI